MVACLVASLPLLGCGSSSDSKQSGPDRPAGTLAELQIVETPPGGIAVYSDVIKQIPPGSDVTYCTYTKTITDQELFVHEIQGAQTKYGHHVIAFYTEVPEPARTEECFGQDMAKFRQLIGGGAENGAGKSFWEPPPNVGTVIPKGAQFVVQTHWINTGQEPIDAQGMFVTIPGADNGDRVVAGTVAVVDTVFKIPANGHQYVDTTECVFDTDHHMMMQLGHEHEKGTHVKAEVLRVSGQTDVLFDRPFTLDQVFNPKADDFGPDKPLLLAKGDKLRMTCEWDNPLAKEVGFPLEMCVYVGYSLEPYDAHCVDGVWDYPPKDGGAAPSGPSCVAEGASGNEKKVGEYCSAKGGQCTDNGSGNAIFCAADFGGPTACTMPCTDASECGAGAVCVGDSPTSTTKGCMPLSCAPSWALDGGAGDAAAP